MTGGGNATPKTNTTRKAKTTKSPENEPTPHPLRAGVSGMNDSGAMLVYVTVSGQCETSQGTIWYERIEN